MQKITKKCIVHIPNYIEKEGKSGSNIRPLKMKQAFEEAGYLVDFVYGYGKERKKKIKFIKEQIKKGIEYDFLYSESSTMPTLLTEKNHFPKYINLDFDFFAYCRKHGIKIGLFYRDVQWKFDIYTQNIKWFKKIISIPMYKYDLYKYRSLVDVFYLPTEEMKEYLKEESKLLLKSEVLMPGCVSYIPKKKKSQFSKGDTLAILYVGGVDKIYDLSIFFETIKNIDAKVHAYVCCRQNEWRKAFNKYDKALSDRVTIIHESGSGLEKYYEMVDICCAFAGEGEYMKMAMPVKIFEYLGHEIPIIATKNTVAGNFVDEKQIGWSVDYSEKALEMCLKHIINNPNIIDQIKLNEKCIREDHTWTARAKQVINDLTKGEEK